MPTSIAPSAAQKTFLEIQGLSQEIQNNFPEAQGIFLELWLLRSHGWHRYI